MEVYSISFYDKFKCLGDQCPSTCCVGWKVPVDPDSLLRYHKEKGILGIRLNTGLSKDEGIYCFNKKAETCPFFGRDKLCSLQCQKGHDFLPLVCRRYPRSIINHGPFVEVSLQLACPLASRLFLDHFQDFCYEKQDFRNVDKSKISDNFDQIVENSIFSLFGMPNRYGTNDDFAFLQKLKTSRQDLISCIQSGSYSLNKVYGGLISYGRQAQSACISGDFSFFEKDSVLSCFQKARAFSFDAKAIDLLITSGLYHIKLRKKDPLLFDLCRYYFKTFDNLSIAEANSALSAKKEALLLDFPELNRFFPAYYSYYLLTSYLEVFESYSFLKNLTFGMIHTELIFLFFCLFFEKYGHLTREDMSLVISCYEKRARHNEDIMEAMYERLYPYLPES